MKIPTTQKVVDYVNRYGGRCRDCADHNGTCPGDNLPCDTLARTAAVRHVLRAVNYGVANGYIKPAQPKGAA